MTIIIYSIALFLGFYFLVKGADYFVSGSSAIAERFNIPRFLIGLTIVACGTSLPEVAICVTAAVKGANGIAIGNAVGSNMFNLLVVLGSASLFGNCPISRKVLRFEYPLSFMATVLLFVLSSSENRLSRIDGAIFLLIFLMFMFFSIKRGNSEAVDDANVTTSEEAVDDNNMTKSEEAVDERLRNIFKLLLIVIVGIAGILLGGDMVVNSASAIAGLFGIDEEIIGLTIVAFGTSLPELVISVVAAKRGETEIAVGNVIGSNLFNILLVLGISSVIHPILVVGTAVWDIGLLVIVSLVVFVPFLKEGRITKQWGIFMLVLYGLYSGYVVLRGNVM